MSAAAPRLVICRPQGGLNDLLCQIERVCRYAETFRRTVAVDTNHPTSETFRDDFAHYFESLQPGLAFGLTTFGDIRGLAVRPRCLNARGDVYGARYDQSVWRWVEDQSGEPLSFDFDRDHGEPVLVHQSDGGGQASIRALARMRLSRGLAETLEGRLANIGGDYVGVHVRNTDYRTNYVAADLPTLIGPALPVFIATDDRRVVAHFRRTLGERRVFSFATLPDPSVGPLHRWHGEPGKRRLNEDAILDLLMLGLAKRLHLFGLEPNFQGTAQSGFSLLAANLNRASGTLAQLRGAARGSLISRANPR